jgi:hypothetical protein
MRITDTPMSAAAAMSSMVPSPGSIRAAIFARFAVSTATFIKVRSLTLENP